MYTCATTIVSALSKAWSLCRTKNMKFIFRRNDVSFHVFDFMQALGDQGLFLPDKCLNSFWCSNILCFWLYYSLSTPNAQIACRKRPAWQWVYVSVYSYWFEFHHATKRRCFPDNNFFFVRHLLLDVFVCRSCHLARTYYTHFFSVVRTMSKHNELFLVVEQHSADKKRDIIVILLEIPPFSCTQRCQCQWLCTCTYCDAVQVSHNAKH